jgi:hypothetical protein
MPSEELAAPSISYHLIEKNIDKNTDVMENEPRNGVLKSPVVGKLLLESNRVTLLPLLVKDTSYF